MSVHCERRVQVHVQADSVQHDSARAVQQVGPEPLVVQKRGVPPGSPGGTGVNQTRLSKPGKVLVGCPVY